MTAPLTPRDALLGCPFCGNQPLERLEKNPNGEEYPDHWIIWCENLDCTGNPETFENTLEESIKAWNTRTHPAPCAWQGIEGCDAQELAKKIHDGCPHNTGFDFEIGPIGCRLVANDLECVCELVHMHALRAAPASGSAGGATISAPDNLVPSPNSASGYVLRAASPPSGDAVGGTLDDKAIAEGYSDWSWNKNGDPIGRYLPHDAARLAFHAGAKFALIATAQEDAQEEKT